ncbi:MAG: phosphomannomutase/phosphoglucomutase [Methanomicrobiales archaeon]|nr:phosphomannomutase/phosphoglucomutase [Methanomicrobiales archaeon]MDI6877666.1 phosphomannomutase/phosphoglucomutase [Methanomicrobiales archaeon]
MNPAIFRAYDIRGVYGQDFAEREAEAIARAFATMLSPETVVIGGDNRFSTPPLREALARGLRASGVDVIDVGTVPTPLLNFAVIRFGADGGIMVTASHLEKEYNGFKLAMRQAIPLIDTEIQRLKRIVEEDGCAPPAERPGRFREEAVAELYRKDLIQKISIPDGTVGLKVAVDTGNGTGGPVIRSILDALGVEAIYLFNEPDGNYPNHHPDPTVEESLDPLRETIQGENCDLGIAMDGDADRVVFLDDRGQVVRGDQALAIFARDALAAGPNAKILFEVKCSRLLPQDIEAHGGIPVMGRTGHSFIKRRMKEEPEIAVAGEMSGHFFFRAFHSIDDAFYASAKMIEILSRSGRRLSEILATLPRYYSTPEIRIGVPEERKFAIVEEVKEEFRRMKGEGAEIGIVDTDGVRVEFPDGWGLVRASNTSPYLILRFEAEDEKRLEEIRDSFMAAVQNKL